ncbi:MAG: Biotin carboxyl carrier protein of acetyl-CoA carboxylase [Chlamydiae bacterium]|nr:Biotin carboxyl carrier protein of acetyl-CoA carboxylase [Chlamydiota bacterium]
MDHKQIEKLMVAMGRHKMRRVVIKEEGLELELEKEGGASPVFAPAMEPQEAVEPPKEKKKDGRYITSPMVGTFYSASSPENGSFVKAGDQVDEETVVCILEAMKVMNEVKAGLKGKIAEILVKNGDPVEFGTKIFRVA